MKATQFIKNHKLPVSGVSAVAVTAAFVLGTHFAGGTVHLQTASDTTAPSTSQSQPADSTAAQTDTSGTAAAPSTTPSTVTAPDSANSVTQVPAASQSSNPAVQMNEAQQAAAAPTVVSQSDCWTYTSFADPTVQNPDQISYSAQSEFVTTTYSDGSSSTAQQPNSYLAVARGTVPTNQCQ